MPLMDWINSNLHNDNQDWIIGKIKNIETAETNTAASEEAAAGSAASAAESEENAAASETNAAASATAAGNYYNQIRENVSTLVTGWMDEHITPTTPPVDDTLTIQGAAADAKVTGDKITDLKNAISDIDEITVKTTEHTETTDITSDLTFTDGYMNTSGQTGASSSYKYTNKISVAEGNVILSGSNDYNLRYITAYSGDTVVPAKGAENVSTYTVPSEIDSVIVTIYSATDLVAGTVKKTVTTIEKRNINDEAISEIKNNTIYERTNSTDITASLTFTDGYVTKQGVVVSGSTTYKYSTRIDVNEGEILSTAEYPFRYVTAYSGNTAVEAKSAEAVMSYTVPSGISEVILTMYIASTRGVMKGAKEPYNLFYNSLSQKNVGYFEKPYICLSCDDGADELATYTIPMIIAKGVPCTFGLYKTSPVFQHGYTQIVVDAVNNNNCEIAQHGGQHSWTDYNAEELVAFFDDEELFWKNIGVDVKSAIYPTHLSNPMVRAITGSRFGCCRSGYNYDGILYYDDESKPSGMTPYYGTGARSNLYAMSSWNMPAGKDLQFAKDCIDWAIANNKLIHFYWHDWDLDSVSKQVLEDAIDYAKTQDITFIKLSQVKTIT